MGAVILKNVPIDRVTELKNRSLLQMVLLLASLECLDWQGEDERSSLEL